jgi:hypothetical protein
MKHSLFLLGSLLIAISTSAQIKPKSKDWFAYDLSHSRLLNGPESLTQRAVGNGHSISFTGELGMGSHFSLASGLGFHSDNYYNNIRISTNQANGAEVFTTVNYDTINRNKLTAQYLHIPVELRFRSTPNAKGRYFRFYVGGRAGVRIHSYSNYRTDKINVSFLNLGSLERFDYGVYTRIGYHYFSLYAYYGLSPIFSSGSQVVENLGTPNARVYELDQIRTLNLGLSFSL